MSEISLLFLLKALLKSLCLPPLGPILLVLLGAMIWPRRHKKISFPVRTGRKRAALFCMALGGLTFLSLSLPITAHLLTQTLLSHPPLSPSDVRAQMALATAPQAIVVLGGGLRKEAPEYGRDQINSVSLMRLQYGIFLAHQTHLPLLVSGGKPLASTRSEAETMALAAQEMFHHPVRWIEDRSENSYENAVLSSQILKDQGVSHIFLVTHALHMRRAALAFRQQGLKVTAAPTAFPDKNTAQTLLAYFPSATAMAQCRKVLTHWLGISVYSVFS